MTTNISWRRWIQSQDTYSPQLDHGKSIGRALESFETSLLSRDTSIGFISVNRTTKEIRKGEVDYPELSTLFQKEQHSRPLYEFFFVNRFLSKHGSETNPPDPHKLRISTEALRLLMSRCCVSPAFLFALSRFYLPNGRGIRRYEDISGQVVWNQWYFLPIRVQVPCTDQLRSHNSSTTGSNQTNPFHYLHLPDEKVDIRASQIAVYISHDGRIDATTIMCFNFMDGRWPKVVEEPQLRMLEALNHSNVSSNLMSVHLIFLTTVMRWWNNALHSVNEQLIAYEKRLQEESRDELTTNNFYSEISKALHAMAAHVHRYETELNSLEDTGLELAKLFVAFQGQDSASLAGIDQVKSQLKAINAFVKEQGKTVQNILTLLFNRMQITNDRMVVSNGKAMHAILKATQEEVAHSREIAIRSQQLAEEMKKDSVSMKTIAILTLFFLPATSFAAVLAMPFFATNKSLADGRKVWIWVVLTVPTTAVAYAFYHFWRKREQGKGPKQRGNLEMNGILTGDQND